MSLLLASSFALVGVVGNHSLSCALYPSGCDSPSLSPFPCLRSPPFRFVLPGLGPLPRP